MKRTASVILIALLFAQLFSQEMLKVTKKDNTVLTIPTSEIANITFSRSEQPVNPDAVYDADGNSYNIVRIGLQTWTGKNLETTKFRNGDPIMKAGSEAEWMKAAAEGKPAWCYYLDASESGKKYGKLYNWYAVSDRRGLAPEGWRVSAVSDWEGLVKFLANIPGAKLKEAGKATWIKNADNATNETGFTALPGGLRNDKGKFYSEGSLGKFWTSDMSEGKEVPCFEIYDYTSLVLKYGGIKGGGFSVRCVKE
jgi:uncharacterized protein (TIGR02145 family)